MFAALIIVFGLVAITQIITVAVLQDRREEREKYAKRGY